MSYDGNDVIAGVCQTCWTMPCGCSRTDGTECTFRQFITEVEALLNSTASGKGYNQTGANGPNVLYAFVKHMSGGHQHAMGEIIYKITRYAAKGNIEDILKVAAWAFLIYKHHDETAR